MKRSCTIAIGLLVMGFLASGVPGRAAEPAARPPAVAGIVNVKDYGAKGDGVTDDHGAIQQAINAAPAGSTIYFPMGTYYFATGVRLDNRTNLVFTAAPGAVLKAAGGKGGFIFAFTDCADLTITGLNLDLNGVTYFGPGMNFHSCRRIRIDKNHFYDSNYQPKMTADRYAICFALGAKMSEDIWITENLIEHLQVEIDKARRVHVLNNRSLAPELATGFGSFTLQKNVLVEDIEFVGNYVEDPQAYGINVAADGLREGAVLRRILIANNMIVAKKRAQMLAGIMVGTRDAAKGEAGGARYEGVTIVNNTVWYGPGVPRRHQDSGIRVQVINPGDHLSKVLISGNTVIDESGIGNYGIETRNLTDAIICNNAVYGCRAGILGEGWTRVLAHGNRVSDVAGSAYTLRKSGGENHFANNAVFGKVGAAFSVTGLQPSDRVEQSSAPASAPAASNAAPATPADAAPPQGASEKSDVTADMKRIANAAETAKTTPSPAAGSLSQSFDSKEGLRGFGSTGVEGVKLEVVTEPKQEGNGAVKLSWTKGSGSYNAGFVTMNCPVTDITGKSFEVWVRPLDENADRWRVLFYDNQDTIVETHQLYVAEPNQWTNMKFTQGEQGPGGWHYDRGSGDLKKVVSVQFVGTIKEGLSAGTPAAVIWDGFKMVK